MRLVIPIAALCAGCADPQVPDRADDALKKAPESGYASVNGLSMYYEVHGKGDPLVVLHGGLCTIDGCFGSILPALAADRKVIAIEQQAHGRTTDIDRPLDYTQ